MCISGVLLTTLLPMASLWGGFAISNFTGKAIVMIQLASSVVAAAIVIGKNRELNGMARRSRTFQRNFQLGRDVLYLFLLRKNTPRPSALEVIYNKTCDRMVKLFDHDQRSAVITRQGSSESAALSPREIELVRGMCESTVQVEELRTEYGMGVLATVVTASPMLGLLGTVWGVLDAFALMGDRGTVLLSDIAPAISAALVTTVVGLLIAIPCAIAYNNLAVKIRHLTTEMESFADELMSRIACEFQGRDR